MASESDFLKLPQLILEKIVDLLPLRDKKSVRLSCKDLRFLIGELRFHFTYVRIYFAQNYVHVSLKKRNGRRFVTLYWKLNWRRWTVVETIAFLLNRERLTIDEMRVKFQDRDYFEPQYPWDKMETGVATTKKRPPSNSEKTLQTNPFWIMYKIKHLCSRLVKVTKFIALLSRRQEYFIHLLDIVDPKELKELAIAKFYSGTNRDLKVEDSLHSHSILKDFLANKIISHSYNTQQTIIKNFAIETNARMYQMRSMQAHFVFFNPRHFTGIFIATIKRKDENKCFHWKIHSYRLNGIGVASDLNTAVWKHDDLDYSWPFTIVIGEKIIEFYSGVVRRRHKKLAGHFVITHTDVQQRVKEKHEDEDSDSENEEKRVDEKKVEKKDEKKEEEDVDDEDESDEDEEESEEETDEDEDESDENGDNSAEDEDEEESEEGEEESKEDEDESDKDEEESGEDEEESGEEEEESEEEDLEDEDEE